jgi:hypothetical protein
VAEDVAVAVAVNVNVNVDVNVNVNDSSGYLRKRLYGTARSITPLT